VEPGCQERRDSGIWEEAANRAGMSGRAQAVKWVHPGRRLSAIPAERRESVPSFGVAGGLRGRHAKCQVGHAIRKGCNLDQENNGPRPKPAIPTGGQSVGRSYRVGAALHAHLS